MPTRRDGGASKGAPAISGRSSGRCRNDAARARAELRTWTPTPTVLEEVPLLTSLVLRNQSWLSVNF